MVALVAVDELLEERKNRVGLFALDVGFVEACIVHWCCELKLLLLQFALVEQSAILQLHDALLAVEYKVDDDAAAAALVCCCLIETVLFIDLFIFVVHDEGVNVPSLLLLLDLSACMLFRHEDMPIALSFLEGKFSFWACS